jgi:hypothetical protein
MRKIIKHRFIEIIGMSINLVLISKYLLDKLTIRCEPCIGSNDCPPCQTDYMKNFWIYMIVLNLMFVTGIILKRKFEKK